LAAAGLVCAVGACKEDGGTAADVVAAPDCSDPLPYPLGGKCVACLADEDCPEVQSCNQNLHLCVCPDERPYFDGTECRKCLADKHCKDKKGCDQKTLECVDVQCSGELRYVYDGQCVECTVEGHCKGDLVCDPADHACKCEDPDLKELDAACVECTKSSECQPGQVCNSDENVCQEYASSCPPEKPFLTQGICVECLEDADCKKAGYTCLLTKHACMPPPLECDPPTPYELNGKCLECLATAHCPEGMLCKEVTKTCEEPVSTGQCQPNGTGKTVGFQIGDFQVVDCEGTPVSLHDYCGQAKAVWLITVAGWCGACDQYAPEANQIWLQYKDKGLQLLFVLGEDPQGNKPSTAYCKQWTASHSVTAPVLIDASWGTLYTKVASKGTSLPWDFLFDGDDMKFVWEAVDYSTQALLQNIEKLLAD
jgi:hypothetical protein